MNLRPFVAAHLLLALLSASGCTALGKMGQVIMDPSIPVGAPSDQPTQVAFSLHASPTLNANPHSLDASAAPAELEPSPYAVSLVADDPYALAAKVASLLENLEAQYPSGSAEDVGEAPLFGRLPVEESSVGSYQDADVYLRLPDPVLAPVEQIATPIAIKILQLRDDSLLQNSLFQALDQDPAKALRSTYVRDDDYLLLPGQFKFVRFEPIDADTRFIAVIANYANKENATWRQVLRIEPRGRHVVLSVMVNDTQILLQEES